MTLPRSPADPALWSLILTNTTNPLPEGYAPELASVGSNSRNGEQFMDARVKEPLEQMFAAAKADGIELVARSAYRSTQEQTTLFNSMKQDYINQGMSEEEAFAATKQWRNEPGTSEHETGLAVDIVGAADINAALVESLEERDWAVWLREHAPEYGFILRYMKDKTDITGTSFEPWHYRYVNTPPPERRIFEQKGRIKWNALPLRRARTSTCFRRKNSTAAAFPSTSSGPPPGSGPRPRPCCRWCWSGAIRAARI